MSDVLPPNESRAEILRHARTLALTSERDGDVHLIALQGELDLDGAAEFEHALKDAEATDAPAIVVDLAGLDFIDSTGLRLLVEADVRLRADAGRLILRRPTERILRVFQIAGLDALLPFADA
jgi:anti-sigma B factor antagonist